MNKEYINLRRNIICLREAYGETLEDLALAVGLSGPAAIGNYESGQNVPKREIIIKIANHYNVTVDELLHGDFTGYDFKSLPIDDKNANLKMADKMLPLICSKKAMQNQWFKKGYDLHVKIYDDLKEDISFDYDEVEKCLEYYENAFQKNGILEAVANIIWWLYFFGFAYYYNESTLNAVRKLNKKEISKQEFLKYHFLSNDKMEDELINKKAERKQYVSDIEDDLIKLINVLKKSNEYSDLADFYLAIRYYLLLVNNDRSDAINIVVGIELLQSFAELGNVYAQSLLLGYQ